MLVSPNQAATLFRLCAKDLGGFGGAARTASSDGPTILMHHNSAYTKPPKPFQDHHSPSNNSDNSRIHQSTGEVAERLRLCTPNARKATQTSSSPTIEIVAFLQTDQPKGEVWVKWRRYSSCGQDIYGLPS